MPRISLMIDAQEGVSWQEWTAIAAATEAVGLQGLFRSDHLLSVGGRADREAHETWTSLAAVAATTTRIELGTLVSPVTFRHPSLLAKMAVTVDHISGGRLTLGMGAGWNEGEHHALGFPLPDVGVRMDMLGEQLEIVRGLFEDGPTNFAGSHYELHTDRAEPKPVRESGIPIILGGLAGPRSVALAARWADEYNTIFPSPAEAGRRRERVHAACRDIDRPPIPVSVNTGCILGADEADFTERARRLMDRSGETGDYDAWLAPLKEEWIVGTVDQARERLEAYEQNGIDRFILQNQLHDDLDVIELLGQLND